MKPIKLIINTSSETYPIIIGSNLIKNLSKIEIADKILKIYETH